MGLEPSRKGKRGIAEWSRMKGRDLGGGGRRQKKETEKKNNMR